MNIMKATQYFCHSPFYFNQKKKQQSRWKRWKYVSERVLSANFLPLMITLVAQYFHIERNMFGSLFGILWFFSVCMWCFRCDEAPIFNEAGIAFCPLMLIILFLNIYREWNIYDLTFSLIRLVDLISAIWLSNLSSHVWWIDEIVICATIREFTSE